MKRTDAIYVTYAYPKTDTRPYRVIFGLNDEQYPEYPAGQVETPQELALRISREYPNATVRLQIPETAEEKRQRWTHLWGEKVGQGLPKPPADRVWMLSIWNQNDPEKYRGIEGYALDAESNLWVAVLR